MYVYICKHVKILYCVFRNMYKTSQLEGKFKAIRSWVDFETHHYYIKLDRQLQIDSSQKFSAVDIEEPQFRINSSTAEVRGNDHALNLQSFEL